MSSTNQPKKAILLAITKVTSSANESTISSVGQANAASKVSSSVSQSDPLRKAVFTTSTNRSTVIQTSGVANRVSASSAPSSSVTASDLIRRGIVTAQQITSTYADDTPFDKAILLDISDKIDLFDRIVSFIRDYADTASPSDTFSVLMARPVFDETQTTDTQPLITVGKNIVEIVSHEDLFSKVVSFVRQFEETVFASDSLLFNVTKGLIDDVAHSEVLSFDIGKILADTATSLSIPAISTTRPLSNSFVLLDQINIQSIKAQVDTITYSSNGRIISQDYVDNNEYFLDDYVGQSVTFN